MSIAAANPGIDRARLLEAAKDDLAAGRAERAASHLRPILERNPKDADAHFLMGLILVALGKAGFAVRAFESCLAAAPDRADAVAQLARVHVLLGAHNKVADYCREAIRLAGDDPIVLETAGAALSAIGDNEAAEAAFLKALESLKDEPRLHNNLATVRTNKGDLEGAAAAYEAAIALDPLQHKAHWALARLRKATDHAHIRAAEAAAAKLQGDPQRFAFVAYGIAKEYEDLKDWDAAWDWYAKGAKARRSTIQYDPAADAKIFETLERTQTAAWLKDGRDGHRDPRPIFVIGMPRTGTTLIERILTSHPAIRSAGELQQFPIAVKRAAKAGAGVAQMTPAVADVAYGLDPAALGRTYMESTRFAQGDRAHFLDKLPVNHLFAGLIAKALPDARFVLVSRDPMDSCFANFKQLFAQAYYFSYDLGELARYYVGYHRLMTHWKQVLGDRLIEVAYEDVVDDLAGEARRMICFLGLPWTDACINFHENAQGVATASSAQVREKVYASSVGRWRRFEAQLEPVRRIMMDEGVIKP